MIKRRHNFSLIEIIIATSLFSILIFSTTTLFFRYHKLNTRLLDIRPYAYERAFFYEKMLDITLTLDPSTISQESPHYSQYLSFTFDNGFVEDTKLSGKCTCELYKEFNGDLIYKISDIKGKSRKRILLKGVDSFTTETKQNHLWISLLDKRGQEISYTFSINQEAK
jgi:hypothetical protein